MLSLFRRSKLIIPRRTSLPKNWNYPPINIRRVFGLVLTTVNNKEKTFHNRALNFFRKKLRHDRMGKTRRRPPKENLINYWLAYRMTQRNSERKLYYKSDSIKLWRCGFLFYFEHTKENPISKGGFLLKHRYSFFVKMEKLRKTMPSSQ